MGDGGEEDFRERIHREGLKNNSYFDEDNSFYCQLS